MSILALAGKALLGKGIRKRVKGWGSRIRGNRDGRDELKNAPVYNQDPTQQPGGWSQGQMQRMMQQGQTDYRAGLANQQRSLDGFNAQAEGRGGPSLAENQLAASTQQNVADQQAMAAGQRGGNLSSQSRQGAAAGAAAQMAGQQQASQLRAQEQAQARQSAAALSSQMAGQGMQQQQGGMQGLLGAQGQAANWGLGQRELDQGQLNTLLGAQGGNRQFGLGISKQVVSAVRAGASRGGKK